MATTAKRPAKRSADTSLGMRCGVVPRCAHEATRFVWTGPEQRAQFACAVHGASFRAANLIGLWRPELRELANLAAVSPSLPDGTIRLAALAAVELARREALHAHERPARTAADAAAREAAEAAIPAPADPDPVPAPAKRGRRAAAPAPVPVPVPDPVPAPAPDRLAKRAAARGTRAAVTRPPREIVGYAEDRPVVRRVVPEAPAARVVAAPPLRARSKVRARPGYTVA